MSLPSHPVLDALTGPQSAFGHRRGRAVRFDPDVTPFSSLPPDPEPGDWDDLAALAGPGAPVVVVGPRAGLPPGWRVLQARDGVQMDGAAVATRPDPDVLVLGAADAAEMRDLAVRTEPGPWKDRTARLGRYLGIRDDAGRLVAMAGERMRGPGWTEISAVCTDPAARGNGYAERLVRAVAHGIAERGDRPLLHALGSNEPALRLYRRMGFVHSGPMYFDALTAPAAPAAPGAPGA